MKNNERKTQLNFEARFLSNILNTTTDTTEYYTSLKRFQDVMTELDSMKGFWSRAPLIDAIKLNKMIEKSRKAFEERKNETYTNDGLRFYSDSELKEKADEYDLLYIESYYASVCSYLYDNYNSIIEIEDLSLNCKLTYKETEDMLEHLCLYEEFVELELKDEIVKYKSVLTQTDFEIYWGFLVRRFNEMKTSSVSSIVEKQKFNFDNMTGVEFEKFCVLLLEKNGFESVKTTSVTGDHGIDIIAERNEITYAIQCKCYSSNIGNFAVQQAHTGKSLYKKDIAVVMTNQFFTTQAIEEAECLGVKLWDRNKIIKLMQNAEI